MDCRFCKEGEPELLDADGVRLAATRVIGDCWVVICLDDAYWAHAVDDTWIPCARKAAEEHAIVVRLPHTADGVVITLRDFIWRAGEGCKKTRCQVDAFGDQYLDVCDDGTNETETREFAFNRFYSSEAVLDEKEGE